MKLSEYVAARRKQLGKTQKDLADALSYTQQALSRFESKDSALPLSSLPALCRFLDCSYDDLFRRNETNPRYKEEPFDSLYLGSALANLRTEARLTQEEMAKRCNLSSRAIGQYENGVAEPSVQTMERWCAVCKCKPSELIKLAASKVPPPPRITGYKRRHMGLWVGLAVAGASVIALGVGLPIAASKGAFDPSLEQRLPGRIFASAPNQTFKFFDNGNSVQNYAVSIKNDAEFDFSSLDSSLFTYECPVLEKMVETAPNHFSIVRNKIEGVGPNLEAYVARPGELDDYAPYCSVSIDSINYPYYSRLFLYPSAQWKTRLTDSVTFQYGELLSDGQTTITLARGQESVVPLTTKFADSNGDVIVDHTRELAFEVYCLGKKGAASPTLPYAINDGSLTVPSNAEAGEFYVTCHMNAYNNIGGTWKSSSFYLAPLTIKVE